MDPALRHEAEACLMGSIHTLFENNDTTQSLADLDARQ